jgi:superfamily II DNA or RNA helicase
MVTLEINNRHILLGGVPLKVAKDLVHATSYLQAGYLHSPAWQGGYWDGRRKLISMLKDDRLKAPAGLALEIYTLLRKQGIRVKIVDNRKFPDYRIEYGWNQAYSLRDYQVQAVKSIVEPHGGKLGIVGRGILKLPPRSGKTLIGAALIREFGVRTLFIVPSTFLLHQSREVLREALQCEIGAVGDDIWETRDVTVATIQTLIKRRGKNTKREPANEEYLKLIRISDLVIWDEFHHILGDMWRKVIQDSSAPYKVGLSATAFLDHEQECELGVIWLRASAGDIRLDISVSDLIEQGHLVRPHIKIYPMREPDDIKHRGWSQRLHSMAILNNPSRNSLIVKTAKELLAQGRRIAIISNRLEQVGALGRLLNQARVPFARLTGQTSVSTRSCSIKRFKQQELNVLLGTVIGEGVDVPEIDTVIVAEGGAGIKATYQRLRNLTPFNGKKDAIVVDFMDLMHPLFADHSMERLSVYRSERAFKVSMAK